MPRAWPPACRHLHEPALLCGRGRRSIARRIQLRAAHVQLPPQQVCLRTRLATGISAGGALAPDCRLAAQSLQVLRSRAWRWVRGCTGCSEPMPACRTWNSSRHPPRLAPTAASIKHPKLAPTCASAFLARCSPSSRARAAASCASNSYWRGEGAAEGGPRPAGIHSPPTVTQSATRGASLMSIRETGRVAHTQVRPPAFSPARTRCRPPQRAPALRGRRPRCVPWCAMPPGSPP